MTEEKKTANQPILSGGQQELTCVRCLGKIPAGEEFCPHCKSPALWSQPEFIAQRQDKVNSSSEAELDKMARDWGAHPYQTAAAAAGRPARPQRDFTKPLLLAAALILIALGVYYVWDKNNNQPSPEETQAITLVKTSHVLDADKTVEEVFAELAQSSFEVQRIIGWQAKQAEGNVYFVAFLFDHDLYGGNGSSQYIFEADLASGAVKASDDALIKKYQDLGFLPMPE